LEALALPITKENYEQRKNKDQIKVEYGLFIFREEVTNLTKATKKKKAIISKDYKKENKKSYKNISWLDKMYDRKMKGREEDNEYDKLIKVIMPLSFPPGFKLYDHKGEYYGTVIEYNEDSVCYVAVGKQNEGSPFLPKKMSELYIKAAAGSYGFTVPYEDIKDFERKN
jgi:hypothetical protein